MTLVCPYMHKEVGGELHMFFGLIKISSVKLGCL